MSRIPIAGPWITQREIDRVTDAVTNAWYDDAYTYNERFESAFADYVGRAHAISLPSCTSALHLSLVAAGVGAGDEVVVPDITWIATAAPASYVGATPIFADIDPGSWCIDADSFEARITDRTRAAVVVDLYGNMPDMDRIQEIADEHGIAIIEDAAQAVGAEYAGAKAGSFGLTSTFSFHGTKTLTTGEGGMLVTDDDEVHRRCLYYRDHCRDADRTFWHRDVGFKYRMSGLQAALGLAQLERVDELIERKRRIFGWYRDRLGDDPRMTLNDGGPRVESTYWMVTAVLDPSLGLDKEALAELLAPHEIDTRPFFHPLSSMPAYGEDARAEDAAKSNRNAYAVAPYGINLPSALNLTEEQVAFVCDKLLDVLPQQP